GCSQPECDVACDCGRFVEIWNLVFMQFNRDDEGKLTPLPNPSIDTGMGLERISALMQGVKSNFDTDLFQPIIKGMEKVSPKKYGESPESDISFRVIADHARAAAFLIADDILPSNEGRGYILRRIIRRASRHGKMMGLTKPFLYQAADIVVDIMRDSYPELAAKRDMIEKIVKKEEESFSETLEYGMQLLEDILSATKKKGSKTISGNDAFKLYDTFGFPIDLTVEVAEERGFSVDIAAYEEAMEEQKVVARSSWKGDKGGKGNRVYLDLLADIPQTPFFGYERHSSDSRIIAIIKDGQRTKSAKAEEEAEILLDKSVFYGESGGQVGDTGKISGQGLEIEVFDTQKPVAGLLIHRVKIKSGSIKEGDQVEISIDRERREDIERNHSATHILHSALKKVLGSHVKQSGSSVTNERLRFDYSHFSAPTKEELERVEAIANEAVINNMAVVTEEKSLDEAMSSGATALFGEKYGDSVRVVKMGDVSLELCGGCHVSATGKIGLIKIVAEGGVAAGVRRIEAYTGRKAYRYVSRSINSLSTIRELLNASPDEEIDRLKRLLDKNKELEKALNKSHEDKIRADIGEDTAKARDIKGIKVLSKKIDGADINALRLFIDSSRNKLKSGVIVGASVADGKVILAVGVTKDITDKVHAGKLAGEIAKIVDGKGGGRPDMAQAGGNNPDKLEEALDKTYAIVEDMLS
ncbi:MAG: alanine--tRNA ligase, partial [Nitrospinota bacterium]